MKKTKNEDHGFHDEDGEDHQFLTIESAAFAGAVFKKLLLETPRYVIYNVQHAFGFTNNRAPGSNHCNCITNLQRT